MMILDSEKSKLQRGSIMLEVIAVLALMGVMGAMLFRQIYQRNQELHNIQMASEIRTVKEAFAAYIQANAADIQTKCHGSIPPPDSNEVRPCSVLDLAAGIKEYLPDGWFTGDALGDYYHFTLWFYRQRDASQAVKMYGVIAPTDKTLPATGWNFKRAARVSLLIGADGGAYASGITNDDIAGSLGTWHLDVPNPDRNDYGLVKDKPTYVAMTGLDNFTPEYDKEEVRVGLQDELSWQVRDLNAYHLFSVAKEGSGCFKKPDDINHNMANDSHGVYVVLNDNVANPSDGGTCLPTFWVDPNNGTVNTSVDLNVGKTSGGANNVPAMRLSKDGVILFSKTVKDPQDNKEKSYLLDPAYTSILNDIKLISRGGASLSDILPNYILKSVEEKNLNVTATPITMPTCPENYQKAVVLIPHLNVKTKTIALNTASQSVITGVSHPAEGEVETSSTNLTYATGDINENPRNGGFTVAVGVPTIKVWTCTGSNCCANNDHNNYFTEDDNNKVFCVKSDIETNVIAQTYCVFQGASTFKSQDACEAAGYAWNAGGCEGEKQPIKRPTAADWTAAKTESECYALGGSSWNDITKECK